jgi:hypothetical protein
MFTWKRWWLLFSVIWVVVAAIQAVTLFAFSPDEREKIWRPVLLGIGVPAVLYLMGWITSRLRQRKGK